MLTTRKEELAAGVTLYLGDCRDVLPTLGRVDAVITDPPYGVDFQGKNTKHTSRSDDGYEGDDDARVGPEVIAAVMAQATRGLVFPGIRGMWRYPEPYEIGAVSCPSGAGNGRWGWTCSHPILYYGRPPTNEATPNGFTSFDTAPPNGHPCPKPLRWMKWAVNKASLPGELVLDPFAGSGTTGVAAVQLGRKFIGIERVESYFDIARARIADALARPDLFIEKPARAEPLELPLIATGRP